MLVAEPADLFDVERGVRVVRVYAQRAVEHLERLLEASELRRGHAEVEVSPEAVGLEDGERGEDRGGLPVTRVLQHLDPASEKNKEIEYRLSNLDALSIDMDNEHKPLLFKIAFSPIDGDIKFGEALIRGASKGELLSFYNKLYEQFEQLV